MKGVAHRYADRALLKPLLICPVYCRFCFRREDRRGPDGGLLTPDAELDAAFDWFAAHPAIREIILTGGDPMMLSPRRLGAIMARLSAIPHIETVRIHTRVPTTDPGRITGALVDALATDRSLWVALHANHAKEFSAPARAALARLRKAGIPLLGQTVLLRDVNDTVAALEDLFRAMVAAGVKPCTVAPSTRCGPRHGQVSCADRRGPTVVGGASGAGHRARMADVRAGYSRRARQSSDRPGLPGGGWVRSRSGRGTAGDNTVNVYWWVWAGSDGQTKAAGISGARARGDGDRGGGRQTVDQDL